MPELSELDQNVLTLRWMQEDYGHLVDVALDSILDSIESIRESNPEVALYLSKTFEEESFWERSKKYAIENYYEALQDNL